MTIKQFELHEMRLRASSDRALAATRVADQAGPDGLPLLSSIEDDRDVAVLRAVGLGDKPDEELRAALSPYVASRRPVRTTDRVLRFSRRSPLLTSGWRPPTWGSTTLRRAGTHRPLSRKGPVPPQQRGSFGSAHLSTRSVACSARGPCRRGLIRCRSQIDELAATPSADLGVRIYAGGQECSQTQTEPPRAPIAHPYMA
jgi:hypothetical protein